jgi:hypothetical protein
LILQISWYLKDQGKNAYLFMILPRTSGAANPLYPYQHYAQGAYLFELKKYFTPHSPPLWLPNDFLQDFQTVRLKCRLKNYPLNNKVLDEMLMEYVRATQEYLAKGSLDGLYTPSNHSL